MPRRKKRSTNHNKAPLIFTESPVNKQNNPPVPVYCSEHPQTAVSIPVEEFGDLTWVSPQFNQVPLNDGGKTRASRRRSKPAGSLAATSKGCTCPHSKENVIIGNKRNKFKPLRFLGERSLPETVIEDINITTDEEDNNFSPDISSPNEKSPILKRKVNLTMGHSRRYSDKFSRERESLVSQEYFPNGNLSVNTPDDNCRTISVCEELKKRTESNHKHLTSPVKALFPVNLRPDQPLSPDSTSLYMNSPKYSQKINPNSVIIKTLGLNTTVNLPPNSQDRKPKILVADTPEAEYSIPVKIRRLRSRLINL